MQQATAKIRRTERLKAGLRKGCRWGRDLVFIISNSRSRDGLALKPRMKRADDEGEPFGSHREET
jgi:hypothetical protein